MILGVEHIALSCENVVAGAQQLKEMGYRTKFVQERVPNHPTKKPLLTFYEPLHAIAYCQAERGVSIELTQHSSRLCDTISPYQVLLNKPPFAYTQDSSSYSWESVWRDAMGCIQPLAGLWTQFHAQFWYDAQPNEAPPGLIRALLLPINNLSVSEKFWVKGLGCRVVKCGVVENGRRWMHICFQSPVPAWSLDVILAECSKEDTLPYLDMAGFPCLAIITNRMSEDLNSLMKMGGHEASEKFGLEVGGKMLEIVVLRGPDNELVELIEFQRS